MSVIDELEIIIRQKDGKVVASIPQLNLYAKAANVDAALASLDAKKAALVAEMEELGELGSLRRSKLPHPPLAVPMSLMCAAISVNSP